VHWPEAAILFLPDAVEFDEQFGQQAFAILVAAVLDAELDYAGNHGSTS
jgi:hypothetical protein